LCRRRRVFSRVGIVIVIVFIEDFVAFDGRGRRGFAGAGVTAIPRHIIFSFTLGAGLSGVGGALGPRSEELGPNGQLRLGAQDCTMRQHVPTRQQGVVCTRCVQAAVDSVARIAAPCKARHQLFLSGVHLRIPHVQVLPDALLPAGGVDKLPFEFAAHASGRSGRQALRDSLPRPI
jgi:hypothetical protein